jgi:hypothetical protein
MSDINNLENQLPGMMNPGNGDTQTEIGGDDSVLGQDQNSNTALVGKVERDKSEDFGDGGQSEMVKE